jgi:ParB-like chromosome segregation protein Spo0J
MAKLTMTTKPEKASVNNSGEKAVGVELYLDQITKAEPFASLFTIKPEVLAAIKADIEANSFDPSKPVNVWKKPDGTRVLIDGYTRVLAAEELGLLRVTAYEKTFASEAEALAYAIHTQRDRRNLSDAEILRLVHLIDRPQKGFKQSIAGNELLAISSNGPIGEDIRTTSKITAEAVGISNAKVKRARAVLADPKQTAAVLAGEKTIHQAVQDAKAKRNLISRQGSAGSKQHRRSKTPYWTEEDALAEGHRILLLLNALSAADPDESRRSSYKSTVAMIRRALK